MTYTSSIYYIVVVLLFILPASQPANPTHALSIGATQRNAKKKADEDNIVTKIDKTTHNNNNKNRHKNSVATTIAAHSGSTHGNGNAINTNPTGKLYLLFCIIAKRETALYVDQ